MMKDIKSLWRVLIFPHPAEQDGAHNEFMTRKVLVMMCLTLLVVFLLIFIGWALGYFDPIEVVIIFLMVFSIIIGLWLSQRGYWQFSSYIQSAIVFTVGLYGSFTVGLRTTLVFFCALAIILSGMLHGRKAQWIMAALFIVGLIGADYSIEEGSSMIITISSIFIAIALLQQLSTNQFARASAQSREYAAKLSNINKSLQESETRSRAILSAIPDMIMQCRGDGTYTGYSGLEDDFPVPPSVLIGKKINEVLPSERAGVEMQHIADVLRSGRIKVFEYQSQVRDEIHHYEARMVKSGEDEVLMIVRDITNRKRIEDILITSHKLMDLGTLAAGVAHEMNSPLQVITGLSERYIRQLAGKQLEENMLERDLETINLNAWRIAGIIRSLLTYAHPSPHQVDMHQLNDIVEDTLLLTEHQLRSWFNITIEKELADGMPSIRCDRNNITQVIINLLGNAADAMPAGGLINIHTGYDQDNKQFTLLVSDTGCGIPEEMQAKVFEPFFTTKEVGKGTGLGLSIVHAIVQTHGGEIDVESTPNKGTTFTIHLPQEPPPLPTSASKSHNS